MSPPAAERSRRLRRGPRRPRAALAALAACAAVALLLAAFALLGGGEDPSARRAALARTYLVAWQHGDYRAMHRMLPRALRREVTVREFADYHRGLLATATAAAPPRLAGPIAVDGDVARAPLRVETRAFGEVRAAVALPIVLGEAGETIRWRAHMAFPGLRRGERLTAELRLPPRATLLAADGAVLAEGAERVAQAGLEQVASETVGIVGEPDEERARELRARGVPEHAAVGLNGLERALDERLIGTPGGTLRAGARVLASRAPAPAAPVRTTIVPAVVRAAADALAGREGGAVAVDPRNGALLGFAGSAFSALRAPGSTFKIVTLAAALQGGVTTAGAYFAPTTEALLDGAPLQNANGELCGGTLIESFAHSCNSVFAPLGASVGADRLAATARRFGFNAPPDVAGAPTSTVPDAADGSDALTVGSSAIGQGEVLASPLQMTSVAVTIARGGVRPRITLDATAAAREPAAGGSRAVDRRVAATIQQAMRAVVAEGTGGSAAIDGVAVAGKTGTAELGVTQNCDEAVVAAGACDPDDPTDTDAWFVGYAPADAGATARIAVGVVLLHGGAGGDTAAPVARELLAAGLAVGISGRLHASWKPTAVVQQLRDPSGVDWSAEEVSLSERAAEGRER